MNLKATLFIPLTLVLSLFSTFSLAAIYHSGDIAALKTITKANGAPIYVGNSDADYAQWTGISWSNTPNDKRVKYLSVSDAVTHLDVTNLGALEGLYCINNTLNTLNVNGLTSLVNLHCYNNNLTNIDVSTNTALEGLLCHTNQLSQLDISNNTSLKVLACSNNQLTNLNVSNNTGLVFLYCYNNLLTTLDVSQNTAIYNLNCSYNRLTNLNLSNLTALTMLSVIYNNLPFSSIKTASHNGSFPANRFDYSPQNKIFDEETVSQGTIIDYSNEILIGSDSTEFVWYNTNGTSFNGYDDYVDMPQIIEDGVFKFNNTGQYYCRMVNAALPNFYYRPLTTRDITVETLDSSYYKMDRYTSLNYKDLILYFDQATQEYQISGWSTDDLPLQLHVFDMNGKQCITDIINTPYNAQITRTNHLKPGVYIVNLKGNNNNYTGKFIK